MNFARRSTLPELMDAPGVPKAAIAAALRELEIIGKRLGGYAVTINALRQVIKKYPVESILDIGFGGGDTLRAVAGWARRSGISIHLTGVDRNPEMAAYAIARSKKFPEIKYFTADVFDDALLKEAPHVVMSSLFCHHFDDEDLIRLLRRMVQICGYSVIINDLHRHPFAYYSIRAISRIFSRSYLVKHDAPLSVARSFTGKELRQILKVAGITKYSLKWRWAWRWQIIIPKQTPIYST